MNGLRRLFGDPLNAALSLGVLAAVALVPACRSSAGGAERPVFQPDTAACGPPRSGACWGVVAKGSLHPARRYPADALAPAAGRRADRRQLAGGGPRPASVGGWRPCWSCRRWQCPSSAAASPGWPRCPPSCGAACPHPAADRGGMAGALPSASRWPTDALAPAGAARPAHRLRGAGPGHSAGRGAFVASFLLPLFFPTAWPSTCCGGC